MEAPVVMMNNPTMREANADAVREIARDIVHPFSGFRPRASGLQTSNFRLRVADYTSARRTHAKDSRTHSLIDDGRWNGVGAGECREYRGSRAAHAHRGLPKTQRRLDLDPHRRSRHR